MALLTENSRIVKGWATKEICERNRVIYVNLRNFSYVMQKSNFMVGFFSKQNFRKKILHKFYYAKTPYETLFTKMILRKSIYERNFTKE